MNRMQRQALYIVLGVLLIAGGAWGWFVNMEQRWVARFQISDAALQDPMLAAGRLLDKHRYPVRTAGTLAEAMQSVLPDGTLLLLDNGGIVTREQAAQLQAWVKRDNTLIVRPKISALAKDFSCNAQGSNAPADSADANDADPIGAAYGVSLAGVVRKPQSPPEREGSAESQPCLTNITLPGSGHALQLGIERFALAASGGKTTPLSGDEALAAVRIHASGTGRVVFLAENYFDNHHLPWYDNAELLLGLAALNHNARQVLIVQHLDMPSWYQALWWHFKFGIVSAGCVLALLLWLAMRRFGPQLPDPEQERRSLIEHIDASGRWLWKAPGGCDILLGITRESTEKLLARRAPELLHLTPAERASDLAQRCGLAQAEVMSALYEPASKLPNEFTRQIQTLQQLRKHHER